MARVRRRRSRAGCAARRRRDPDGVHRDAVGGARTSRWPGAWRRARSSPRYFARGYRAVEFFLDRASRKGTYLLVQAGFRSSEFGMSARIPSSQSLLVPERDHRIDAHRAPRGDDPGDDGQAHRRGDDRRQRGRIGGAGVEQQARDQPAARERSADADQRADPGQRRRRGAARRRTPTPGWRRAPGARRSPGCAG